MNEVFIKQIKSYFPDNWQDYLTLLEQPYHQGLFLNTNKADKKEILDLIDFEIKQSNYNPSSYYHHNDSIGKSKVFDLGLIYPQDIASSFPATFIDYQNIKTVVDLCSAPGGKTINVLNNLNNDVLCIANDINHRRSLELSKNLERLGLDNVIITNKDPNILANQLKNFADLVILDAPCSGEGMIRKYPDILNNYSLDNINQCSIIQKQLLENAYDILNYGGQLLYCTCTYALQEDENQIIEFLNNHDDMELVELNGSNSIYLKGTIKLSPLNDTEGQFICLLRKKGNKLDYKYNHLNTIKDKAVDNFIKDNLNISNYYLYKYNNHFYLSLIPLIDLGNNIIKYGIYLGDIDKNQLQINHHLYRSNSLRPYFKYIYELNDEEYLTYISGNVFKTNNPDQYYLLTYHNHSIGYGINKKGIIKNKYPKGLRRMI